MAVKYLVFIGVCLLLALTDVNGSQLQVVNGRIKITVGTTAGCGDTVNFITNQLAEAYNIYGDFMDVEFVPWGRTVWHSNGTFACQFREDDCWANRLHRCVLNMLGDDRDAKMEYMACEFSRPYPSFLQGTYQCAQTINLNLVDVDNCVANPGDDLDLAAEAAAAQPMAQINFVPYILFNDVIDVNLHNQARQRLTSMICFALADDPNTTGITSCKI